VRVDLPPGLPNVVADPPVMERVIANLTANAQARGAPNTRGGLDRRLVAPAGDYTGAMRPPEREPEP